MRWLTGFGIVPQMEIENEKTRRPRRRFRAEEKARIVGLFQHFLAEASAFQARSPPTVVTRPRESHRPTGRWHVSKAFLNTHLHSPSSCRRAHHFLTFLRWPLSVCESARPGFRNNPNYLFLAESTPFVFCSSSRAELQLCHVPLLRFRPKSLTIVGELFQFGLSVPAVLGVHKIELRRVMCPPDRQTSNR